MEAHSNVVSQKYRDWTPEDVYKGYELDLMEHDDGDVVKWDWTIYKFVERKDI